MSNAEYIAELEATITKLEDENCSLRVKNEELEEEVEYLRYGKDEELTYGRAM